MTVILYTQPGCGGCSAQKNAFDRHGIPYQTVNVHQNPEARERLIKLGATAMPVVEVTTEQGSWWWQRPDLERTLHLADLQKGKK